MKLGLKFSMAVVAVLLFAAGATDAAAAADGKATFSELKCTSCHAVKAAGVAAVVAAPEEGEEASEPSDLSGIGAKHDAKWMKDWLMKKVDVDGKKHRKKFDGTPEQLDALATWLASLKEPAK